MDHALRTAWAGDQLVVYRDDALIDSFKATDIRRVVLVYRDRGENPGDLLYGVVELPVDYVILPADTGFAGRVLFEHQSFWEQHDCIYWVSREHATLPGRLRRGRWFLHRSLPVYMRVPHADVAGLLQGWPLEGPQTWEQRKWERIHRSRPFADPQASLPGRAERFRA